MNTNANPNQRIARRVRQAREEAELSQEDMGRRLGLTRGGYGHYETGRQPFPVDMLFQISGITDRPVEWFLGLDTGLTVDEGQLLASYRAVADDAARRLVLAVVRDAAAEWRIEKQD